jgi:hypothetical protein
MPAPSRRRESFSVSIMATDMARRRARRHQRTYGPAAGAAEIAD